MAEQSRGANISTTALRGELRTRTRVCTPKAGMVIEFVRETKTRRALVGGDKERMTYSGAVRALLASKTYFPRLVSSAVHTETNGRNFCTCTQ